MDQAFERGSNHSRVYRPGDGSPEARVLYNDKIRRLLGTPHTSRMRPVVAALIVRNMHQILGDHLDDPVSFVVTWTPTIDWRDPEAGGTRYALALAALHQIPVANMRRDSTYNYLRKLVHE